LTLFAFSNRLAEILPDIFLPLDFLVSASWKSPELVSVVGIVYYFGQSRHLGWLLQGLGKLDSLKDRVSSSFFKDRTNAYPDWWNFLAMSRNR
jgi:hypothetical protein